ncbi:MAG: RIP metalloprotease RseP [Acidobacteria bacterium]|nr:MAG: RIP metalloprotease RseP [Acidobacteriota bacterium]
MNIANIGVGFILVLGVLILVHEWGHFVVARLFGVRVDVFSIGFGPRLFGWKRGATDYRISAFPLGGYVRMAGQDPSEIDSGDQAPKPTEAPDELMSKKRWQRSLISLAGPVVNLIMPIVLLGGFYAIRGFPYPAYMDKPIVLTDLPKESPLAKAGISDGDQIVSVNDVLTPTWAKVSNFLMQAPANGALRFLVEHHGTKQTVEISAASLRGIERPLGYPPMPPILGQVMSGKPAARSGLKSEDLVLSVNGTPVRNWPQCVDLIRNSNGQVINIVVRRAGKEMSFQIHALYEKDENGESAWRIGVGPGGAWSFRSMTVTASVKEASVETVDATGKLISIISKLFTGKLSVRQLQSFVGIAVQAGQAVQEGPVDTINLMAVLSLNLGILNLLPIPILDGGNILLLAMEGIRRRDFSMAFKERFVQVGLVFLLVLFAYVMYNDVMRLLPIHS